jgi:hypothetical protein
VIVRDSCDSRPAGHASGAPPGTASSSSRPIVLRI